MLFEIFIRSSSQTFDGISVFSDFLIRLTWLLVDSLVFKSVLGFSNERTGLQVLLRARWRTPRRNQCNRFWLCENLQESRVVDLDRYLSWQGHNLSFKASEEVSRRS